MFFCLYNKKNKIKKVFILENTNCHHKYIEGLNMFFKHNYFKKVNNILDADIIFIFSFYPRNSLKINLDINNDIYKNKIFIIGPSISIYDINDNIIDLPIKNNNVFYNTLSYHNNNFIKKYLNIIPTVILPFPIDTERFNKGDIKKKDNKKFFIYIKHRHSSILFEILKYLDVNNILDIITYDDGYNENYYLNILQSSRFGIWIGSNETQGFALLECLSCDVPLFVVDINYIHEEINMERNIYYRNIEGTSIPYWDDRCGEYIKHKDLFSNKFIVFMKNLLENKYKPREYILENMNCNSIFNKIWKNVI